MESVGPRELEGCTRLGRRAVLGGGLGMLAGCIKVKGQGMGPRGWATRIRAAPEGISFEPGPPEGVYWLAVGSAKVPPRTPNGRLWDDVGGWPDPKVVITADGRELLGTAAANNTITPTWPQGPWGNFKIAKDAKMEAVVYDADTLNDRPIGRALFRAPGDVEANTGQMTIDVGKVGNPGHVVLKVEKPHALIGVGFDYELFETKAVVSKVLTHGPAERAGIRVGDVVVSVAGKLFRDLTGKAIKSAINSISASPVEIIVKHDSGITENYEINEGPIYALYEEWGDLA